MRKITYAPGEHILAELTPTRRSTVFPVLELALITGIIFLLVGFIDAYFDNQAYIFFGHHLTHPLDLVKYRKVDELQALLWGRRALLVLWLVLAWRRCFRHLLFRQRARIILTTQRLITASGHMRSEMVQVPLSQVVDARQRGSEVSVYVAGSRIPWVLRDVPYSKRFVQLLRKNSCEL